MKKKDEDCPQTQYRRLRSLQARTTDGGRQVQAEIKYIKAPDYVWYILESANVERNSAATNT